MIILEYALQNATISYNEIDYITFETVAILKGFSKFFTKSKVRYPKSRPLLRGTLPPWPNKIKIL